MVNAVQSVTGSLLEDARHAELTVLRVGSVREHGVDRIRGPHPRLRQCGDQRQDGRGRLDALGVDAAKLLDVAEDRIELAPHALLLVGVQSEPGEPRDVFDLRQRDLHLAHRRVLVVARWVGARGQARSSGPAARREAPDAAPRPIGVSRVYTSSSGAYFSRRRFRPTEAKFTV